MRKIHVEFPEFDVTLVIEMDVRNNELWIGVKGQTNLEIAGSPRNAFRCSVR